MVKADSKILGFIIGLILPIIGTFIFWGGAYGSIGLRDMEILLTELQKLSAVISIGLLANLPGTVKDTPIDEAISSWARQRDYGISYTWPSLLDHRDEGTLVEHRDGQPRAEPRTAWCADWRESWESTTVEILDPEKLRAVG